MLNFQNFKFANEFTVGIFGGKNLTSAYIPLKYNGTLLNNPIS